jgi:hypothetical protein
MVDEDPEIEESPLSGTVTRDGITVRVEIYRLVEGDHSWTLEVIDHEGGSTVWDDRFATDKDAHAEFYRTLETDPCRSTTKLAGSPGRSEAPDRQDFTTGPEAAIVGSEKRQ